MMLPVRHRPGWLVERTLPGRHEPISAELDDLYDRMSHFLEAAAAPFGAGEMAWAPLAEMRETDEAYVVEVEVPGIKREDIDVQIAGRELVITGELKESEYEGVVRHRTRRSGRFEYRALLSSEVKAENVSGSLDQGVLTVTVPKAKAAKPRHIEITAKS